MLDSEMNLSDAYQQIREFDASLETHIVPAHTIIPQPNGKGIVDGKTYSWSDEASHLIRQKYSVPTNLELRLPPDAQDALWRALVAKDSTLPAKQRRMPPQVKVMFENEKVIGICDAELVTLRNSHVIEAIEDATQQLSMQDAKVGIGSRLGAHSWELQIIFPFISKAPREGDFVNGGVSVRFSPVGLHALQVRNFLHRCWCNNGAVIAICVDSKQARIRSRANDPLADRDMQRVITKVVSQGVRELDAKLDAVAALTKESVNAAHMISVIAQKNRLSTKVTNALMDALVNDESETLSRNEDGAIEGKATYYEIWNSLTRLATRGSEELLRPGIRERLQAYAGCFSQAAVHTCPTCKKTLAGTNLLPEPSRN